MPIGSTIVVAKLPRHCFAKTASSLAEIDLIFRYDLGQIRCLIRSGGTTPCIYKFKLFGRWIIHEQAIDASVGATSSAAVTPSAAKKVRRFWECDGVGKSSLHVLLEWLAKEGKYERYLGNDTRSGKTKVRLSCSLYTSEPSEKSDTYVLWSVCRPVRSASAPRPVPEPSWRVSPCACCVWFALLVLCSLIVLFALFSNHERNLTNTIILFCSFESELVVEH